MVRLELTRLSATVFETASSTYSDTLAFGAADQTRTGTGISAHWILSPGCLPIPPLRHIVAVYSVLPLAIPLHILLELSQVNPLYSVYA